MVLRRHGSLVLAELRIEQNGPNAWAACVYMAGEQLCSVPSQLADAYRGAVQELASNSAPVTLHAKKEIDQYVDVWGLCKPQRRRMQMPSWPVNCMYVSCLAPPWYQTRASARHSVAMPLDQEGEGEEARNEPSSSRGMLRGSRRCPNITAC
jgi:hypothetical protein